MQALESAEAGTPAASSSGFEVVEPVQDEREQVIRDIGTWIRACLDGRRRGLSGREKLPQGSRIYLCFEDVEGRRYNPVRVFRAWPSLRPLVSVTGGRSSYSGNSI